MNKFSSFLKKAIGLALALVIYFFLSIGSLRLPASRRLWVRSIETGVIT